MNLKTVLALILTIAIFNTSTAQEIPQKADLILNNAFEQAELENKNIFILFHASWCGWCKKMDTSMNTEPLKYFFESNYVIEHLVVQESKKKKHLENPNSAKILKKYGGDKSGIPYWLIFDSDGNLLADSKMVKNKLVLKEEGSNIGCPGTEEEVAALIYKLKSTSDLTDEQLALIATEFRKNNPD
jgi:thiol-disulfide isomerase/thioredoxin